MVQCKTKKKRRMKRKHTYLNGDLRLRCVLSPSLWERCGCCACAQRLWVRSDFSWRQENQTSVDVVQHREKKKITHRSLNNAMRDSPPDSRAAVCCMRAALFFGSCAGCLSAGTPPAARPVTPLLLQSMQTILDLFCLFVYLFILPPKRHSVSLWIIHHTLAHTHATCVKMNVFNGFGAEGMLQNDGGTSALQRARRTLQGIIAPDIPLMLRQRPAASSITTAALTGPCPVSTWTHWLPRGPVPIRGVMCGQATQHNNNSNNNNNRAKECSHHPSDKSKGNTL